MYMLLMGISIIGPYTCITQNLLQITYEVLIYSCLRANDIRCYLSIKRHGVLLILIKGATNTMFAGSKVKLV